MVCSRGQKGQTHNKLLKELILWNSMYATSDANLIEYENTVCIEPEYNKFLSGARNLKNE